MNFGNKFVYVSTQKEEEEEFSTDDLAQGIVQTRKGDDDGKVSPIDHLLNCCIYIK